MALVLVMGVPGSGKSALCRWLLEVLGNQNCSVFSFDEIFRDDGFLDYIWPESDNFASLLGLYGINGGLSLKEERKRCENLIREELRKRCESNEQYDRIVLVDDIFYLRSMRRPFERIAKRFGLHFGIIYVNVSLDTAIKQNEQRRGASKIPKETIHKIYRKIEMPRTNESLFLYGPNSSKEEVLIFLKSLYKLKQQKSSRLEGKVNKNCGNLSQNAGNDIWRKLELDLRKCVGELIKEHNGILSTTKSKFPKAKKNIVAIFRRENIIQWNHVDLKATLWKNVTGK